MNPNTSVLTKGRLPWYGSDGKPFTPYIIGIAGGSASGKTSVSQRIIQQLGVPWVVLISMDSFYKSLGPVDMAKVHAKEYNFDHPDAFDYDCMHQVLSDLRDGKKVELPVYCFKTHRRLPDQSTLVYGANVIIFEGILSMYDQSVRDLMNIKLFVDTDSDVRLARRLIRDISERGRDVQDVLSQYHAFVKPAFDEFIYPQVRYADVIIPRGLDNVAAIDLITKHVKRQLKERGILHRPLLDSPSSDVSDALNLPESNVIVLDQLPQLHYLHTIIRDVKTSRHDFIFYSDRLSRMVVEKGLSMVPFSEHTVQTPTGEEYSGLRMDRQICGVSVVRAGAPMETALREVVKDIPLGKILIQTDKSSPDIHQPQLHYCKLPKDISKRVVLLVDAQIATGAAALMAIRVLLDHDVQEENIIFLTLLATPQGIATLLNTFPAIRIVTSAVDATMNEKFWIEPGFGSFGDRYFGTCDP